MNANQQAETTFRNPLPRYAERYGLSSAPFSSQHEDRFLYLDAERLQRLNMLEHLTRYSELLLIISGPPGIGKTALRQRFCAELDEDIVACQVEANPMMNADQLLQAVARGFGLPQPPGEPAALQEALYRHLAALHHRQKTPLLIIDDAHVLPQDALETLFNLAEAEASDGNLLRIILFSDPQIETMLQSPAIQGLRERVTHSMNIPPFDEEQTVACIRHRLSVAGLQGALPFSDRELHKIYRNSGGIPARINECAHLLLNGDKLDQAVRDFHTPRLDLRARLKLPAVLTRIPPWQMGLGLSGLLIVVLGLIYQDDINRLFEAPPQKPEAEKLAAAGTRPAPPAPVAEPPSPPAKPALPAAPPAKTPPAAPPQASAPPASSGTTAPKAESAPAAGPPPATAENTPVPEAATPSPEATPPEPATAKPAPPAPAPVISDISPEPVPASRKPQTLGILGEHFHKDMQVTVYWKGGHKTLDARQVKVLGPDEMEIRITVGRQPDEWKIRLTDPRSGRQAEGRFRVVAANKQKPAKQAKAAGLQGEEWIRRQNPKQFTLQLLGSRYRNKLAEFAKRHGLDTDTAIFSRLRNGQPWHGLIHGRYSGRAAARKAAAELGKTLPGIKPWIRPFADIQKILAQQTVTPPAPAIAAPPAPPASGGAEAGAAWLWSQDPSHYTLQLLGGRTEAGIRQFIRQHKLEGQTVYYRTTRNGRPWYVLVYHSYPDRKAARAAIGKLPPALRKTRPWARSFASIHAELP